MERITPAQRSAAWYAAHKADPAWMAKNRARAAERYAARRLRRAKLEPGQTGKMARIDAALRMARRESAPGPLSALEHLAWIAWRGWDALAAAGVAAPFPLLEEASPAAEEPEVDF